MGQAIRYYLVLVAFFAVGKAIIGFSLFDHDPGRDLVVDSLGWAALFSAFFLAVNWKRFRASPDAGAVPPAGR
jgi:hypothetical protein